MKFTKCSIVLVSVIQSLLLTSCTFEKQASSHDISKYPASSALENITIVFVQLPFVGFSRDENNDINGYYFENETMATTNISFERGHFLSKSEIDGIYKDKLNYEMPKLYGDGFWSFTFFVTDYNVETGLADNFLKPQELDKNIEVYFGIYG